MAVQFPDIEKTVVSFLNTQLASSSFSGTRVATKKALPDETQPSKQIVVNVAYNGELNYVTKLASLTLDVWADDYATASGLALWTEAKIRDLAGDPVKQVTVRLGPVRGSDNTRQEHRMLDVELLVKGTTV
jgi:hypothetical protein